MGRTKDNMRTGKRSAVRNNSGQPVDHSGPRLGVEPTKPNTAGPNLAACPPVSFTPSQPKSGPEVQEPGGFLGACVASPMLRSVAKQPSFLDQIKINRNSGRGKYCGRFTIVGQPPLATATQFHRLNCKCWKCSFCGPRKAKRYRYAIRALAEERQLRRFLTLTLDPAKVTGCPVQYLNQVFAKLRVYLRRQYGHAPQYIRILEFQKNGSPHFHILIDRFIPWKWLRASWIAIGGGTMVDIRHVDVHRVSHYLSKYLTKELLLSAPLRSRRVTTSRGLRLFEKQNERPRWVLLRVPIFILHAIYSLNVIAISLDSDGILESFTANFDAN